MKAKNLDFSKVKEGGGDFNKKHYPPGDYLGKVIKVQDAKSKDNEDPMWLFTIQVNTGKYPYYCKFDENQVWKIRNLFIAAGINVPKKRLAVDPAKVVGKNVGVTLEDDEYKERISSIVASIFPPSELNGDHEADTDDGGDDDGSEEETAEESAPPKKPKDKKKSKAAPEPDEEPEEPSTKKKKGKKSKSSGELEALDIEDI